MLLIGCKTRCSRQFSQAQSSYAFKKLHARDMMVPQRSSRARASASVVVVHPTEKESPYRSVAWEDVFSLMKLRFSWEEPTELTLHAFPVTEALDAAQSKPDASNSASSKLSSSFATACSSSDVFVAVDMHGEEAERLLTAARGYEWPVFMVLDSQQSLMALSSLAGLPVARLPSWALAALSRLPPSLPWPLAAATWPSLLDLWSRRSSDDLAFMLMLAVDKFVAEVPSTRANAGGGLASLQCMLTNCRPQVLACLADPKCKAALDGLTECGLNDQVCSYRVIASYESPLFEEFSKCVLQRHNCLCNSADIPYTPDPAPLATFRGAALTHEAAEDIFIGHLSPQVTDKRPFSWRVAAGKNPAYDFFPCQYQLWYRARGKGNMWYDPIFNVQTLDGRNVWRRRHYRVRRSKTPGTFYFSVLDNGVTSNEYWRIIDVAEDLSWAVFYYSGAASAAGITYRGALICTPTGEAPAATATAAVGAALATCGIRDWEMYPVDNSRCDDAPLSVPEYGRIDWLELQDEPERVPEASG